MNKIFRRALTVLPAIILQLLWLHALAEWLAPWAAIINFALSVLAFIFVLYIITKQDEGTYKILWLLIILTLPIPGALLYLLFGNKRTTRPLRKSLEKVELPPLPAEKAEPIYESLSAEDKRLAQTFRLVQDSTGFPLCENASAKYYPLGNDAFPDMLEAMESAQRFIFVEYFIIENGFMWDSMVEVMSRKAAQGVDVRVLYDDFGSLTTYSAEAARNLGRLGIRCSAFNPLFFIKGTLNCRDHRKMLIVDGKVAFSGGINLADEYINKVERFGHWKDIAFRVTGDTVANYTRMFTEFWDAFSKKDPIPQELLSAADVSKDGADAAEVGRAAADSGCAAAEVGGAAADAADGLVLSYYDSPLRRTATSNELYIDLLSQAENYAWFFTPYLLPGEELLDAFVRAARRGVDVRIIMPGIPDKKLVYRMSRSFYPVLLSAGVKIYEYEPGFVHAKGCIIDDRVGSVGTVNLDYRSLFLHFENNSLFYKASLLADLKADFEATQEKCRPRELKDFKTTFGRWLTDGVLRIFAPLC